jgi:predicted exporter
VLTRNLDEALRGLPFAPGLFAPFLAAVDNARGQVPLGRAAFENTAFGARMASLMTDDGSSWMAIVPLRGVADRKQFADDVHNWNMPAVVYVDMKEESNRLMTAYRDRTFVIVLTGLVIIAVVLALGMKSVTELSSILFPIIGSLAVVAAVVNLFGESLSLFHIATFLLVIGLGLDYALFANRPEGSEEGRGRTLYGLLVCSSTTILVFGVLATSRIPVLHAIAGILARKDQHAA